MAHPRHDPSRLRLGVVANEFFDPDVGGMGGFGWAARQVARCFGEEPKHGVDVVYLTRRRDRRAPAERVVHETRMIMRRKQRLDYARRVRNERFDLLLCIDYRPNYRPVLNLLPRTPVVVWVRDPRTPEDMRRVGAVRVPHQPELDAQGLNPIDCTSLAGVVRRSRWLRRPVLFATPAPSLASKVPGTYGVTPPEVALLPNIVDLRPVVTEPARRPSVVFLGRLDPIKRPWLFAELARRVPEADFLFLGGTHFSGPGTWEPRDLPPNARLLGHVGEERKSERLSEAIALVNTSPHEGLAISFLESLACGTPLVASVDPEGVVSRYGVRTEQADGHGAASLPSYEAAVRGLLGDSARRRRLADAGRRWVAQTHSRDAFVSAFAGLARRCGVRAARGG